jgi:hypothetical protein
MLFSGKFYSFPEKYDIPEKIFGISGNFFPYLGKNVVYPESAPQTMPPPQLLEASYAPGYGGIKTLT